MYTHEHLIKSFLYSKYLKLENGLAEPPDIMALLTYIAQREIKPKTRKKIIEKLALYDSNLSSFLDLNISR